MMRRTCPTSVRTSFRILIRMSPFIVESFLGSENRARLSSISVGVSLIDPALTLGNRVASLFRLQLSDFAITSFWVLFPTFVKYSFSTAAVTFSRVFPWSPLGCNDMLYFLIPRDNFSNFDGVPKPGWGHPARWKGHLRYLKRVPWV